MNKNKLKFMRRIDNWTIGDEIDLAMGLLNN